MSKRKYMNGRPQKVTPGDIAGLLRIDYKNGLKPLFVASDAGGDKMMARVAASHMRQVMEDWLVANQSRIGELTTKELKEVAETIKSVNDIGEKAYSKLSSEADDKLDPVDITADAAAAALYLQEKIKEAKRLKKASVPNVIDVPNVE